MVGMDVCVNRRHQPQSPLANQREVHLGIKGGVDDNDFGLRFDDIGKAALASAADLDDRDA